MQQAATAGGGSEAENLRKYELVRGRDGQQYSLVPLTHRPKRLDNVATGSDGKLYKLVPYYRQDDDDERDDEGEGLMFDDEQVTAVPLGSRHHRDRIDGDSGTNKATATSAAAKKKKKKTKKRVTVVVEDASDSENDDDELNSYWRNRQPSEGTWMEPV